MALDVITGFWVGSDSPSKDVITKFRVSSGSTKDVITGFRMSGQATFTAGFAKNVSLSLNPFDQMVLTVSSSQPVESVAVTQIAGPPVPVIANSLDQTITAPANPTASTMTFQVVVTKSGYATVTDTISFTVRAHGGLYRKGGKPARITGLLREPSRARVVLNRIQLLGSVAPPASPRVVITSVRTGNSASIWRYGDLGTYQPGATTSGVIAGSTLQPFNMTTDITQGGTPQAPKVYENLEIFGNVNVRASYVTIRNCRIWGAAGAAPAYDPLVSFEGDGFVGGIVEDCDIRPQTPHYFRDGIAGNNYTARRNNVSAVTDGFGVMNFANPNSAHNVFIQGNYVHDLAYRSTPASVQSDLHTHNDGIQIHSGSNIWIQGNNIQGFTDPSVSDLANPYASSGNQITGQCTLAQTTRSSLSGVHILDNWYDGGGEAHVHGTQVGAFTNTGLEIKRNKHGRNSRTLQGVKYTVRVMTVVGADIPLTGADANVFIDTGLPVNVVRY